jgi:hypothetical protein
MCGYSDTITCAWALRTECKTWCLLLEKPCFIDLQHKVLQVDEALKVGSRRLRSYEKEVEAKSEVAKCLKKADFVGRWFADAGTTATILAAWGIKVY